MRIFVKKCLFSSLGWLFSTWLVLLVGCNAVVSSPAPATTQPGFTPTISPILPSPTRLSPTHTPTLTATPGSQLGLEPGDIKGTIIRFWHTWSGPAGETMQTLIDQFNTSNEWKIIVSPVQMSGLDELNVQVGRLLDGSTDQASPEIVMGYLYQLLSWDQSQPLVDWDIFINDPFWGLTSQEQADFYPVFWKHDLTPQKRLGIPALRSSKLLYYNLAWARSLGFLNPPATPQEFQRQACETAAINRKDDNPDNDGTGGWIISTDYHVMYSWLSVYSRRLISNTVTGIQSPYNFASSETRAAFTFLRELYDQGCAWLPEQDYPEVEFTNRQGLFALGSLMDIPYQAQAFSAAEYQDDWTVIPFPSAQEKPSITVYGPSYGLLPSSPERQLAAWLFIKWLSEPQQQARLVQTNGGFPLRQSVLAELSSYRKQNPQWAAAVDLLPVAQAEPALQSWSVVRWTLSDAGTQLYRYYFTIDQVPSLLEYLNLTAADLHQNFLTPTPTSTLSLTKTSRPTPMKTPFPSQTPVISLTPIPSSTP